MNAPEKVIIWLDPNLNFSDPENQESISQLRRIVHTFQTFTNVYQCTEFIQQMQSKIVFLIIAENFATLIASLEKQYPQLYAIYIFCDKQSKYDQHVQAFEKGRGVFTEMKSLCIQLRKEIRQLENDSISISIIPATANNLNELDPLFMYFQLFKENLLTIPLNHQMELQQFVDYCRPKYSDDGEETKAINELERKYRDPKFTPIWWYTLENFLYKMLNQALRDFDVDHLIKMGFFIQDLHEQIKQRYAQSHIGKQRLNVYRGQGMMNADFDKMLKNSPGGFLSFNNFLSTSIDKPTGERFARLNRYDPSKKAILFVIEIDTTKSSVPFTSVKDVSDIPEEDEILFSMSTVFRIGKIEENEENIWRVNLSLTNDRDPSLKRLTDHMRTSLGDGDGWRRIGQLMIKMSQYDKAMELYKILLKTANPSDKAENAFLHNQLGYIFKQKEQLKEAFAHYQEALKMYRTYLSETDVQLSSIYSNIGGILKKLGDANGALKYYVLVLKIDRAAEKPNQLEIAVDHNNIGSVFDDLGKYPEALKSYEEALTIKLAHLPPNHPSLASTYSNVGLIHRKMGDCTTALSFYEKTLKIQQKSLPPSHPSLIITYGKMATAFEELHRYKEAVEHAQQAVNIANKAYGPTHPETEKRQKYLKEHQLH